MLQPCVRKDRFLLDNALQIALKLLCQSSLRRILNPADAENPGNACRKKRDQHRLQDEHQNTPANWYSFPLCLSPVHSVFSAPWSD